MHRSTRRLSHHEVSSRQNVPFSWEFSPGIPKAMTSRLGTSAKEDRNNKAHFTTSFANLPPPPCPPDDNMSSRFDNIINVEDSIEKQLNSLPVCSLQVSPMVGCLSILGIRTVKKDPKTEDPFLAAFVSCTRSPFGFNANKLPKNYKGKKYRRCGTIKKTISTLSCIYSCNVMKR